MPPRKKNMITSDQVARVRDPATVEPPSSDLTEVEVNADLEAADIEPDLTPPLGDRPLQRDSTSAVTRDSVFNGADPAAFDHDADGHPGGSLPAKAKVDLAAGDVLRKGAPPAPKASGDNCRVRITKAGHDQVHDGRGGRYAWQAEVVLPRAVGKALEERHFGEILD